MKAQPNRPVWSARPYNTTPTHHLLMMSVDHKWEFTAISFHHINSSSILPYLRYLSVICSDILIFCNALLMFSPPLISSDILYPWNSNTISKITFV